MAKTTTRSKSAKTQLGVGVRGRDAEFPSAPVRVTGDTKAKLVDINTVRKFEFSQRPRDKLPERPSTSGGPTANFSLRRSTENRETRDDLHFNPLNARGKGTTFYNFPLPGSLPTPASTPRSSLPPRKSSLAGSGSFTPESMEAVSKSLNVPQMEIGMALGSPTHQPTSWHSHIPQETSTRSPSPIDTSMDGWASAATPAKQKSTRWNPLRGLFGGKKSNSTSQQPFYQLQPEGTITTTVESDYINFEDPPISSEKKPSKPRGRGRTNSEKKTEKHKPDMKRAQTAPLNFDFQDASRGRSQTANPEIMLDGGPMVDNVIQAGHSDNIQGGLMLDVDIPSIHMERYSIMFGNLLQKPTNTSSSLLARRQATLDRLKTVNEALASKERELEEKARQLRPRRATSPQPTKSPAFSLFPNTPSRLTVRDGSPEARRSPLQRSNTSPAALSPSRPSFAPRSDNDAHTTILLATPVTVSQAQAQNSSNHRTNHKKHRQTQSSKSASHYSPKPQQTTRNWSPEQSHLTLDSPLGIEVEEEDIYDPAPLPMRPKFDEPTWQMIKPHHEPAHSTAGSSSSRSDHSTSNSASSISSASTPHSATSTHKIVHIQAPPVKTRSRSATTTAVVRPRPSEVSNSDFGSPSISTPNQTPHVEVDEHEQRLKTAADVSIARQISVSRQQRQLLVPIKTSSASNPNMKYNQNFPSPLNFNRVASPLSAVAAGESPVTGKAGSPLMERKEGGKVMLKERLVDPPVKPSTPTLVVVGGGEDEREKTWNGERKIGLAERRKGREVGEIKVGLAVGDGKGHEHRKSERAVVERVSAASSH